MERLTERIYDVPDGESGVFVKQHDYISAAEKLAAYEDAEEQGRYGRWIPVTEKLPEDEVDVLVWFEYFRYGSYNRLYKTMGISYTYNGKWSGFVNGQSVWNQLRIIAWMPLPEPYRESEV